MKGYKSASRAGIAAERKGEVGLTGSGQKCGPVQLPDGSWGYWTAHSYFDSSLVGVVLLPEEKKIPGKDWKDFLHGILSWEKLCEKID
jgi:hypothetical protein